MGSTAFIFPGQGSQYVGMGRPLWEASEDVRRLYRVSSERSGLDLAGLSFEGPREELDSDVAAQLAVYVCNEAHRLAAIRLGLTPAAVTGYSLGFYSALVAAGCLEFFEGLDAIRRAGELAVESSALNPGTMGAVIGLSLDDTEAICAEVMAQVPVYVSNVNAARQILISGSVDGVDRAVRLAEARGALKAYLLGLGAAYHSPLMDEVARDFEPYAAGIEIRPPSVPLMSYLDARFVEEVEDIRHTVAGQIKRRVLWKDTVQGLIYRGVEKFIEVGPGEALTRMVRWVDRGVSAVSMESLLEKGTGAVTGG